MKTPPTDRLKNIEQMIRESQRTLNTLEKSIRQNRELIGATKNLISESNALLHNGKASPLDTPDIFL